LNCIGEAEKVTPILVDGKLQLNCRGLFIGYAPPHIRELYKKYPVNLEITVYKINPEAPFNYQFLLLATLEQKIGIPFSESEYQTYIDD
jgi:hypothetical protein